jgi:hypothetical protein
LTNTPPSGRQQPPEPSDIHAATARLRAFARAGCCARCQPAVIPLAADVKALLAEVTRLRRALKASRLESANRLAAIHAALGAAENGEPDPLDYLRWEFPDTSRGHA